MTKGQSNRSAEIFGYPTGNKSDEAQGALQRQWCPFVNKPCDQRSGLVDYPLGVCSVENRQREFSAICPHRFEEQGTIEGMLQVLEDIALHYFGDLNNLISFSEVKLPPVGRIDYVLARHKLMQAEVDDFVLVEFPFDSTREFEQAILNKGIIYEVWNVKSYWVFPENVYASLAKRHGFMKWNYDPTHSCRFALYDLRPRGDRLTLTPTRYASAAIDEIDHLPGISNMPSRDEFVQNLNTRLQTELLGDLAKLTRRGNQPPNKDKFVQILNKKLQAKLA